MSDDLASVPTRQLRRLRDELDARAAWQSLQPFYDAEIAIVKVIDTELSQRSVAAEKVCEWQAGRCV